LKGHTSYITQLDWSKDGNYIQSVCGAYELLFWNVNSLSQIASGASQFRD
jgi:WD40 repeat protein